MTESLARRLDLLSRTPDLLVAADYDGTLAPIVPHPWMAEPAGAAMRVLEALAAVERTHVAVISGRSLADLCGQLRNAKWAHLVGSHGGEYSSGEFVPLSAQRLDLLRRTVASAREIAVTTPGTFLEEKPAGVAFHYRNAGETEGLSAVSALTAAVGGFSGLRVRHGKKVVEFSVVHSDKGQAVQRLRQDLGASAVLFVGDDVTDEDAFLALEEGDCGVKVGQGLTAAHYRVDGVTEVTELLELLAERRAAWTILPPGTR